MNGTPTPSLTQKLNASSRNSKTPENHIVVKIDLPRIYNHQEEPKKSLSSERIKNEYSETLPNIHPKYTNLNSKNPLRGRLYEEPKDQVFSSPYLKKMKPSKFTVRTRQLSKIKSKSSKNPTYLLAKALYSHKRYYN